MWTAQVISFPSLLQGQPRWEAGLIAQVYALLKFVSLLIFEGCLLKLGMTMRDSARRGQLSPQKCITRSRVQAGPGSGCRSAKRTSRACRPGRVSGAHPARPVGSTAHPAAVRAADEWTSDGPGHRSVQFSRPWWMARSVCDGWGGRAALWPGSEWNDYDGILLTCLVRTVVPLPRG